VRLWMLSIVFVLASFAVAQGQSYTFTPTVEQQAALDSAAVAQGKTAETIFAQQVALFLRQLSQRQLATRERSLLRIFRAADEAARQRIEQTR